MTGGPRPAIFAWQRRLVWVSAVAAAAATALLKLVGAEVSLVAATGMLAVTIGVFWLSAKSWERLDKLDKVDVGSAGTSRGSERSPPETDTKPDSSPSDGISRRELSPAITAGTNLAITVQGFVLGLVFAFLDKDTATATVKVGVASLGTGVIVGVLLYSLAAISVSGPRTRSMTLMLFNVTLWALCYGLLCLIAAVVALHATGRPA